MRGVIAGHRLPEGTLAALFAGGGDADAVRELRSTQRSKHMLLLVGLLELVARAAARDGTEAGLMDSFDALCAVEAAAPERVADLLTQPQIGAWVGYTLGRVRHGEAGMRREVPLPVDLAHLGSIVAAAATVADVDVEVRAPARHGYLTIPTLGRAILPDRRPWRLVTLRYRRGRGLSVDTPSGTVDLPDELREDAPNWQAVRRLCVETDGRVLRVALDDLDDYRDTHGTGAAARLDAAQVDGWRDRLAAAWSVLVRRHPVPGAAVAAGLSTLVPLSPRLTGGASATSRQASGSALIAPHGTACDLASTLVHEVAHLKLNAVLDVLPILRPGDGRLYYSPWREDPRPLSGLLQGTYAFLAVAQFWRVEYVEGGCDCQDLAGFEFALARRQVVAGWRALATAPGFFPAGTELVASLGASVTALRSAPVRERLERLAADMAADHEARWRLRNLRYAENDIDALARAWLTGAPPGRLPDTPALHPGSTTTRGHSRLRLVRHCLTDREAMRRLRATPSRLAELGVTQADLCLAAGDYAEAAARYRADIRAATPASGPWAGLAVAQRRCSGGPLSTRTELVRAIHDRLEARGGQPPDAEELAGWLGQAEATRPRLR